MTEGRTRQQHGRTRSLPSASLGFQDFDLENFFFPQQSGPNFASSDSSPQKPTCNWQKLRTGFKGATGKIKSFNPFPISQILLHSPQGTHDVEQVLDKWPSFLMALPFL